MWHHAGSDDNGDEVRIVLMVMVVMKMSRRIRVSMLIAMVIGEQ